MGHGESHLVRPGPQNVKMLARRPDGQTDIASTRPVGFASGKNNVINHSKVGKKANCGNHLALDKRRAHAIH